jgi:CRISPR-associated protein Cas2
MYVIISYDITDNKLRNKIAKLLEKYGFRVQKSVFEAYIKPNQFEQMKRRLKNLLKMAKIKY